MPIKSVKMKILKNKKMGFFLMSQGSFYPNIRFLGQKVCPVARVQTDGDKSDYCGHPFRVSGVFPTTYHQGSAQFISNIRWENMASGTEFTHDFCSGIGQLQLGVVLVGPIFDDRLKDT